MRDGKLIIFTKHAKTRCFERFHVSDWKQLVEKFQQALRYEDYWFSDVALYCDDFGTMYVVQELPDRYVVITLYQKEFPPTT